MQGAPGRRPERSVGPGARRGVRPLLLRAAVTLLILGALFSWLPREELTDALRRVRPGTWVGALAAFAAGHVIAAGKWRLLLGAVGLRPAPVATLRAHGAGLFSNLFLPSLVGGDVVRAGVVAGGARDIAPVAVAGVADRVLDATALLALAAAGAALAPGDLPSPGGQILALAAFGLLAFGIAAPVLVRRLDPSRLPGALAGPVEKLSTSASAILAVPGRAVLAFALALGIQSSFVLVNAHLGRTVGIEVSLATWFLAWPLAKLAALAPVSFGGLGVREAMLAALLLPFEVEAARAVAQSLLWESLLVTLGLFAGAVFVLTGGRFTRGARR